MSFVLIVALPTRGRLFIKSYVLMYLLLASVEYSMRTVRAQFHTCCLCGGKCWVTRIYVAQWTLFWSVSFLAGHHICIESYMWMYLSLSSVEYSMRTVGLQFRTSCLCGERLSHGNRSGSINFGAIAILLTMGHRCIESYMWMYSSFEKVEYSLRTCLAQFRTRCLCGKKFHS